MYPSWYLKLWEHCQVEIRADLETDKLELSFKATIIGIIPLDKPPKFCQIQPTPVSMGVTPVSDSALASVTNYRRLHGLNNKHSQFWTLGVQG